MMHAAAMKVELRLRDVHSLKEKRHVVNGLRTLVLGKFPVSFAEVDHQDKWQRATVGIAAVSGQQGQLDRVLHSVRRTIDGAAGVEMLDYAVSHLEQPE
jgi:uncharacterized protein YlxP (DUF503 family)